ncbi:hypothetical protein HK098_005524 [Nowakowskiella sp. JEL0407]|nr:hypothetical protein HK098_005524 [Nowakowskiella sp. JEL0407]
MSGKRSRQQIATEAPVHDAHEEDVPTAPFSNFFFSPSLLRDLALLIACLEKNEDLALFAQDQIVLHDDSSDEEIAFHEKKLAQTDKLVEFPLVKTTQAYIDSGSISPPVSLVLEYVDALPRILAMDKHIEESFNLVLALVKTVETDDDLKLLVEKFCAVVTKDPLDKSHLKLKLLTNLYNTIPATSSLRYFVYKSIVSLATTSDDLDLLTPTFTYLDAWILEWKLSPKEKADFYLLLSESLENINKLQSYEFLLKHLKISPSASPKKAIHMALSIPEVLNFDPLFTLPSIQSLKTDTQPESKKYYDLLKIFVSESLEQFESWWKREGNSWAVKQGMEYAGLNVKIKLLTLSSLAANNINGEVTYEMISSELKLDASESVEAWVIDGIRAGLLEAKMNQLNKTVVVSRATHRTFTATQWLLLAQKLGNWKDNLDNMLQVVGNAKLLAEEQVAVVEN